MVLVPNALWVSSTPIRPQGRMDYPHRVRDRAGGCRADSDVARYRRRVHPTDATPHRPGASTGIAPPSPYRTSPRTGSPGRAPHVTTACELRHFVPDARSG